MTQKQLSEPLDRGEQRRQQEVREYLVEHPDFFEQNPDLLADITLPHESGQAVSLIERQVAVLRERNMEMRQRINNILETAKENDKLFERTKRLLLGLLDAENLDQLSETLYRCLDNDFDIEFYSLTLFGPETHHRQIPQVPVEEAQKHIGTLLSSSRPLCGILRESEVAFLFGEEADDVGSVAAIPLGHGKPLGVLALGNRDPQFYRSSMGTLFLSQIAEILYRLIPRLRD